MDGSLLPCRFFTFVLVVVLAFVENFTASVATRKNTKQILTTLTFFVKLLAVKVAIFVRKNNENGNYRTQYFTGKIILLPTIFRKKKIEMQKNFDITWNSNTFVQFEINFEKEKNQKSRKSSKSSGRFTNSGGQKSLRENQKRLIYLDSFAIERRKRYFFA